MQSLLPAIYAIRWVVLPVVAFSSNAILQYTHTNKKRLIFKLIFSHLTCDAFFCAHVHVILSEFHKKSAE
jgi:hypothetical protein